MQRLALGVVFSVGLGACNDKSASKPAAQSPPPATSRDAGPIARRAAPPKPRLPRADVEALLGRWLAAQNEGDFAAYSALYGDDFAGVRRTGARTVRLDRAGWLRERKRMFAKPMKVAASSPVIAVGTDGAEIRMVQDWASGRYRDIGPKVLVIGKTAAGLRIAREEMLSSTLVNAPAAMPVASPQFALVYHRNLVLGEPPATKRGGAVLTAGSFPTPIAECEESPPEWDDQDRYWTCQAAKPENHTDRYVAERAVSAAAAGARSNWIGRTVDLYGAAGVACQARVVSLSAHGEWLARASDVGDDDDRAAVAEAVLDRGNPVLLGHLDKSCADAFYARDPSLPPPPRWRVADADPATSQAATARLADVVEASAAGEWAVPPRTRILDITPAAGSSGRWVMALLEGAETCHEDSFVAVVWRWSDDAGDRAEVFTYSDRRFAVRAAADFTGDGVPELVLDDGLLLWDADEGRFARLAIVDFTEEILDACHCECE